MTVTDILVKVSDVICGVPFFLLLIGGGLFFMIYSGFVPFRYFGRAIKSLTVKSEGEGQISSYQALASAIAATVGMGSIAGVAVAIMMGGPGAIFWIWVSACVGMATKFFEGTLSIMFKGKDSKGEVQGGPMYMITTGLGPKWRPLAIFFSIFGLVGSLCLWQANQLTEAITSAFTTPLGWENTPLLRLIIGVIICLIVASVILGGINRISKIASKMVPIMVGLYFILVAYILVKNLSAIPGVFSMIFSEAFSFKAGLGGFVGIAFIGARRAALVNEAGIGTASMMHGASKNNEPVREGLVAMLGPAIDSGLVCTLTALAILVKWDPSSAHEGLKGIEVAMNSFNASIPGVGGYLLMFMVLIFSFSTMFSYSYYGMKCTSYLFGADKSKYYNYFFLLMLIVAAIIPLNAVVAIIDIAIVFMAIPTMFTMFVLAPKVKGAMKIYFAKNKK